MFVLKLRNSAAQRTPWHQKLIKTAWFNNLRGSCQNIDPWIVFWRVKHTVHPSPWLFIDPWKAQMWLGFTSSYQHRPDTGMVANGNVANEHDSDKHLLLWLCSCKIGLGYKRTAQVKVNEIWGNYCITISLSIELLWFIKVYCMFKVIR